ncbi:carbon monoxide dehydrogenase, partial [Lawsonibacter sp. DFI.6.74]|nr:carbon monoxide dehydrogenase [Lawsonibacter sp. DFI.6.74]
TFLGVMPPVGGSANMVEKLTNTITEHVGAKFAVHENPQELASAIVNNIESKRPHFEEVVYEKNNKKVTAEA